MFLGGKIKIRVLSLIKRMGNGFGMMLEEMKVEVL